MKLLTTASASVSSIPKLARSVSIRYLIILTPHRLSIPDVHLMFQHREPDTNALPELRGIRTITKSNLTQLSHRSRTSTCPACASHESKRRAAEERGSADAERFKEVFCHLRTSCVRAGGIRRGFNGFLLVNSTCRGACRCSSVRVLRGR